MRILIMIITLVLSASCVHAQFGNDCRSYQADGPILVQDYVSLMAQKKPEWVEIAQRVSKVHTECRAYLGSVNGFPVQGRTSLNGKTVSVLILEDIKQTALVHEWNHLLLKELGFQNWMSVQHENEHWLLLSEIEEALD